MGAVAALGPGGAVGDPGVRGPQPQVLLRVEFAGVVAKLLPDAVAVVVGVGHRGSGAGRQVDVVVLCKTWERELIFLTEVLPTVYVNISDV